MSASMSGTRTTGIKNRAPAAIQISAEQILREAADRQETHVPEPIVKIHDAEEYQAHLRDRRKLFEDNIRYRREHIGNWVKYARFEEENKEYERARSVFERALEVDHRSSQLWLRYAEFEMRNEFVNHARNVFDRAVQILPRVDFLWYKYVFMEESVGAIPKCRAVFERWMKWQPDDNAWISFARFETRVNSNTKGSMDRAEVVMRNYVNTYPSARSFLRLAKWAEYEGGRQIALARTIFEAALSELPPEEVKQARVFQKFAAFEERQGEHERARVIYRHAIDLLQLGAGGGVSQKQQSGVDGDQDLSDYEKSNREELYKAYITFEKKHGDRAGIEMLVLKKQRAQYQKRMEDDPYDYDGWFEWAKLEEDLDGSVTAVREIYERAVAHVPPSDIKDDWRRYIYLWIYYAVYEEITNRDLDRASQIYKRCLSLIPHEKFGFAKIWIMAAHLHVRRKDLTTARKLFGRAIGMCGKEKIYTEYIAMELALGEVDRCRTLYNNYLKAMSHNCQAWSKYAQLEKAVGETERCRALYELAISQPALDMPEWLWKGYIDFEIDEGEADRARTLYQRLLEKTGHVKVWISWAQFESSVKMGGKGLDEARRVYERGYQQLKAEGLKDERVLLLDEWRAMEKTALNRTDSKDDKAVAAVEAKMPRRIKRKRPREEEEGGGWEEYFEYQFPDDDNDAAAAGNFKILEMATKWKEQQKKMAAAAQSQGDDDDSDLGSDDDDDDND